MIHAYSEWVGREVFLIRAGEEALVYPMPWKKQVVAQVVRWWEFWKATEPKWAPRGWGYVIFKGLSDEGVDRGYIEAAVGLANHLTGLPVRWMQKKPGGDPYWLFQTKGVDGKGKIKMTVKKEKLHDITEVFKSDGTLNVLPGVTGLQHFLGQHAAGHVEIKGGHVSIGPQDADGFEDVTISFKRKH